jgi:glycosyltransferase involved in cell wall biosynthesis
MAGIRVLFVSPTGEIGGAEVALLRLLRHLDRTRFAPAAVCLSPGPLLDRLRALDVECTLVPAGRFRHLHRTVAVVLQIARVARRHRSDVIFGNGTKGHLYGALAARLVRRPTLWWLCDMLPSDSGRPLSLNWLATRLHASMIAAVSWATLEAARRYYATPSPICVVYPGLEIETLDEEAQRLGGPAAVRRELNVGDAPLIGIAGRLTRWKGQHVFLEAAARIACKRPEARFVIVGDALLGIDTDYPEFLRRQVRQLGLHDRVAFTGFRPDVPRLLAAMDIVVHASVLPEPASVVVSEAMALGRPVIATALGGMPEIIEDGVSGILVSPGDPAALAAAVLALLGDRERARRIGLAARQRVRERFTAQRMASQMQELLAGLALGSMRKAA